MAKALLEQATLRQPSYAGVLDDVQLRRPGPEGAIIPGRVIIHKPRDDPLEAIMWQTSVGTPGAIYNTVRWLRRARGERLGAMPPPAAFCAAIPPRNPRGLRVPPAVGRRGSGGAGALRVEAAMFALMTAALTLTLGVVVQLWRPRARLLGTRRWRSWSRPRGRVECAAGGDPVGPADRRRLRCGRSMSRRWRAGGGGESRTSGASTAPRVRVESPVLANASLGRDAGRAKGQSNLRAGSREPVHPGRRRPRDRRR